ncbi:MAG: DUF3048 domain-containing protein [Acidimicrobiia bacterium]|nr:DUF3048 domain-containing protein [Acidimicrobiia bacterium]
MVVKIDNDAAARPQAGLNEADLVYEVMVEGITRFAAVYHTGASERVGPVRSARTSDRDLLTNLNRPLFAWSGGNPTVAGEVRRHAAEGKLVDLSEDAFQEAYRREGPNPRPHNLYTSTAAIRGRTPRRRRPARLRLLVPDRR